MTTPVRANVGERLEAMRYLVIESFLVRICLCVRLANALGDDFGITLLMTEIIAIAALHTTGVLQKIATECAAHDVVKLLSDEFMAILLMNFLFPLTNSTFAIQSSISRPSIFGFFRCLVLATS